MKKVKITNIEANLYTLQSDSITYELHITFIGDKKPEINDFLYIPSKILTEKNLYTYGPLNSKYSKNIDSQEEYIIILTPNEEYYLQRYYG